MSALFNSKKYYGLIGYPLTHSFSMDFFNQKFGAEKINAEYLNFEIDDIGKLMEVISEYPELNGLNVTSPYKQVIIQYLDALDETAKSIGAVNVVKIDKSGKNQDVKLIGYNTDAIGFANSIRPMLSDKMKSALVMGSGGAAKAVRYALNKLGMESHTISRRKSVSTITYEELTKSMVHKNLIVVNATPLGMYPNVDACPDFPFRFLTKDHLCYDLIYNPEETVFLKRAKQYGASCKNGLEMLLLQAFASYDIWTKGHFE